MPRKEIAGLKMTKPYEIIEHTADIGLRIYGKDLKELFTHAAQGMFDLITDVQKIDTKDTLSFELDAEKVDDLLLKWLRELLFVFSTRKLIFKDFTFDSITEKAFKVKARGGLFNPKIHDQKNEVKAVTYYDFKVEKKAGEWVAEVIFDI
jgi:SHS2 domain-containing protein